VGGGEKTGVVFPNPGKFGVFEKVPQGIGGPAVDKTLGYEFQIRGGLAEGKTVEIPAEQFKTGAGRGYPLQELVKIDAHTRFSAVTGEGIYTYLQGCLLLEGIISYPEIYYTPLGDKRIGICILPFWAHQSLRA
jgi:hypothetical protein